MEPIQPTSEQCKTLYRVCNELTVDHNYSIDLVRVDDRTLHVVVLYGEDGYLEVDNYGELVPEGD